MEVRFYDLGTVVDEKIKFAVISARYEGQWVYVKHRERDTWEIPGGHRDDGETVDETASRELYEETGATSFELTSLCEYSVCSENEESFGRLYYAEISELASLPESEISEVSLFDRIPEPLTYGEIQPHLHRRVMTLKEPSL